MITEAELINDLVAIRMAHGLKQREVARRLHVTTSAIGSFETCHHQGRSPTLARILAYAWAVGAELRVVDNDLPGWHGVTSIAKARPRPPVLDPDAG